MQCKRNHRSRNESGETVVDAEVPTNNGQKREPKAKGIKLAAAKAARAFQNFRSQLRSAGKPTT